MNNIKLLNFLSRVLCVRKNSTLDHLDQATKDPYTISVPEWNALQAQSDDILMEGLNILSQNPFLNFDSTFPPSPGNYLITHINKPVYIGESKTLNKRLQQHSQQKTSTFFKNYSDIGSLSLIEQGLEISDFSVQFIMTSLGRKELEEFGMVNLATSLNKFHNDKRNRVANSNGLDLWTLIQRNTMPLLEQGEQHFLNCQKAPWDKGSPPTVPGVYGVWDQANKLVYVGESTNISDRYITHSKKTRFSALRRNIATTIFGYKLKSKTDLGIKSKDKKKAFLTEEEELSVNKYLANCYVVFQEVSFGRLELEEYLIEKYKPLLNKKGIQ